MTAIRALNHVSILSGDLAASRAFYCDVLGFEVGPRPAMDFPGLWLYAEGCALIHLIGADATPIARGTAIDHVAFSGEALRALVQKLEAGGIKYRLNKMPEGGWQLFCRDPDGALIEIDFGANEDPPTP